MRPTIRRLGLLVSFLLVLLLLPLPSEAGVDWTRFEEEETVVVVTENEDGTPRETTVWLVVVEGRGYIRTGGTRWGGNVERKPELALRVAGEELALRVEFVSDEATRDAVKDAFRAKYGFTDRMISPFRGRNPKIMRLVSGEQR